MDKNTTDTIIKKMSESTQSLTTKYNSRRFDEHKRKEGFKEWKLSIREFAYEKGSRPYYDPNSVVYAVMEQELERFVIENMWQSMYLAKKYRNGKLKDKPEDPHFEAALELYDAYLYFRKGGHKKLERLYDSMLNKWSVERKKRIADIRRRWKKEGRNVDGEEKVETTSSGKKYKCWVSPSTEALNSKPWPKEQEAWDALQESEAKLFEEDQKHYALIFKNLGHMWI